jgi:adenylate kinase
LGKKIDYALNFEASERIILERLTGRRVCGACGATFHIKNMPPKKDGICDSCGASLIQRKDDQADTIKNRLQVYAETAEPLLAYYQAKGIVETVCADQDYRVIEQQLNALFSRRT